MTRKSLRNRLFLVIVGPLLLVACMVSIARLQEFSSLSRRLYDNALYTVALTISRDVAINEGDMLTRDMTDALVKSLGDTVYYRVIGPSGSYVTGHSDAPAAPGGTPPPVGRPVYFDAVYDGQPVRALYMKDSVESIPAAGLFTVEVWQTVHQRERLSLALLRQSAATLAVVVAVAALLVWFGIDYGLRPLKRLRSAIVSRTADDLRPIATVVPVEIDALVTEMNSLFARLGKAFAARDAFISDAAHQVRTPIAGIQAQAEAALTAKDERTLRERVAELALAARRAGRLTNQLLSMERVRGRTLSSLTAWIDMEALVRSATLEVAERSLPRGGQISLDVEGTPRRYFGDAVLLSEMLVNVLENAERYGAAEQPAVEVTLRFQVDRVEIDVCDNGPGIPQALHERVFDRFFRVAPDSSVGCGLGLSIVVDIARLHGGDAFIVPTPAGCCVRMVLRDRQAA